ncbi:MAG: UPF0182 family protein, partial [Nitrospiraceae bacterium]
MNKNIGIIILVITAALLLLAAGSAGFNLYIDWLFFQEVDHAGVFRTMLSAKITSALAFSAAFLAFYLPNLYFSNRINFPLRNLHLFGDTVYPVQTLTMDRPVKTLTMAGGFLIALLMALFGASKWEELVLFLNGLDVGMKDPVFGRDIGFYLFTLPLVSTVKSFAVLTVIITAAATLLSCFLRGGISWSERNISIHPAVKKHAGIFGLFIFSVLALHFYIEAYRLQYTYRGFIYGAGYTD